MVRKLPGFMFGGIVATAIAGGALAAAAPKTHVMKVVLPDGGVANVEYVGDVAPKVTIMPDRFAAAPGSEAMRFPSFAGFERMMAQMQRQSDELMREAQRTSVRPVGSELVQRFLRERAGGRGQHDGRFSEQQRRDLHADDQGRFSRAGRGAEGELERERTMRWRSFDSKRLELTPLERRGNPPDRDRDQNLVHQSCLFEGWTLVRAEVADSALARSPDHHRRRAFFRAKTRKRLHRYQ